MNVWMDECIDKRKTQICFGGHRCVAGRGFCRLDDYAPVSTWRRIKLQLAMAAIHSLKLKAFDCTAAYLQTHLKKELYVRLLHGLVELLGGDKDNVWKVNQALYGYPVASALWYQKLFTYLKEYGFFQLGNSATFLILPKAPGLILLNVYSDDGLGATDSEQTWQDLMQDFKYKFDLEEKDADDFLVCGIISGCGIIQDESGAIHLDSSKYVREMLVKYDVDRAVCSPLPMPERTIVCMPDDDDESDDQHTNLFQQISGWNFSRSLLRPELQFYAAHFCKVVSRPTEEHMGLARQVLMYLKGTVHDKLTFRPAGCDGFTVAYVSLMSFSDSDWACEVDTCRSHGCHVVMFAGAAIAWRNKTQKSVMLSTAAADY